MPVPAGNSVVVRVAGDIDMLALPHVWTALITALDYQPMDLTVDMSEIGFCGVRGFALLAAMARITKTGGIGYTITGLGSHLERPTSLLWSGDTSPIPAASTPRQPPSPTTRSPIPAQRPQPVRLTPATPRRPVEKVTHDDDLDNHRRTNPLSVSPPRLRPHPGGRAAHHALHRLRTANSARDAALAQVRALSRKLEAGIGDISPRGPSASSTGPRPKRCTDRSPHCQRSRTPSTG